jgi:hypothetical protein
MALRLTYGMLERSEGIYEHEAFEVLDRPHLPIEPCISSRLTGMARLV